jgi:hypothetical protein
MIRTATRSDLPVLTELITEFLQETAYAEYCAEIDQDHLQRLMYAVIRQGYVWLLCDKEIVVGCLIAVKEQNIWMTNKVSLRELVWYVKEQYRRTLGAGRLFVKFCEQGDAMMQRGEIQGYFTTRMSSTTDYDLESRGFRLTEKLYLKDGEN